MPRITIALMIVMAMLGCASMSQGDLNSGLMEATASPSSGRVGAEKTFTISIGMHFVYIAPGIFMMGSPSHEPGRSSDERPHRVTLTKGFYMQTTEVTQRQWLAVMGDNPSHLSECGDDCPVENVSWNEVQEFIQKLDQKDHGQYRLPTEAEWEYAARARSVGCFCSGENDSDLEAFAWYRKNSNRTSHPVARKKPNAWGLYDMHGNVWEWCQDWYGNYPPIHMTDPTGPSFGKDRVYRGGSWRDFARHCRSANRYGAVPDYRSINLGFRLVWFPGR